MGPVARPLTSPEDNRRWLCNTGTNWVDYKFTTKSYALGIHALDILEGIKKPPKQTTSSSSDSGTDGGSDATVKETTSENNYDELSLKLWTYLASTQTDTTRPIIRQVTFGDPAAAWAAFQQNYESDSKSSLKSLLASWINTKQNGRSIPTLIDDINNKKNRIKDIVTASTEAWEDTLSTLILLQSLDEQFAPLKQSLLIKNDLTLRECIQQVQRESEMNTFENNNISATTYKVQNTTTCTHCKKSGHTEEQCYTKHPHLRPNRNKKGGNRFNQKDKSSNNANNTTNKNPPSNNTGFNGWTAKLLNEANQVAEECTNNSNSNSITFDIDSGASNHYVNSFRGLANINKGEQHKVVVANNQTENTIGSGTIPNRLPKVHVVPTFASNLLSVSALNDVGIAVLFHPKQGVSLRDTKSNKIIAKGTREESSFKINIKLPEQNQVFSINNDIDKKQHILGWHSRLGHPAAARLYKFLQTNSKQHNITFHMVADTIKDCDTCGRGKTQSAPHVNLKSKKQSDKPFQWIYIDTKHVEVQSYEGYNYALIIVDDYTRMKYAYPMQFKWEALQVIQAFNQQHVASKGYKIGNILSDGAKEFSSNNFHNWCKENGTMQYTSNPYSSENNGIAERAIQSLQMTARCLRIEANLPPPAWALMYRAAAYIENHLMTKANVGKQSPMEMLYGTTVDTSHIRTIGSTCYVHQQNKTKQNLAETSKKGYMVGYDNRYPKQYIVLIDREKGTTVTSQHVKIIENNNNNQNNINNTEIPNNEAEAEDNDTIQDNNAVISNSQTPQSTYKEAIQSHTTLRRIEIPFRNNSNNENTNKDLDDKSQSTISNDKEIHQTPTITEEDQEEIEEEKEDISHLLDKQLLVNMNPEVSVTTIPKKQEWTTVLPKSKRNIKTPERFKPQDFNNNKAFSVKGNYKEIIKDPRFKKSINEELTVLLQSKAIEVVERPINRNIITSTWVHKFREDGSAKSRLCPRGYQQKVEQDYNVDEVEAATLSLTTLFIVYHLILHYKCSYNIIDVVGAFRIPKLKEPVYMFIPQGMEKQDNKVIRLNHSLNGLVQASYYWQQLMDKFLLSIGFTSTIYDSCCYIKWVKEKFIIILLYVDDLLVTSQDPELKRTTLHEIEQRFPTQYKSQTTYLGIEVNYNMEQGTMTFHQSNKIKELVTLYNLNEGKFSDTPAAPGTKLIKHSENDGNESNINFPYRELVGSLLWIARATRPDILYAVNQLAQHVQSPDNTHIKAGKRIVSYLHTTINVNITYYRTPTLQLEAYADADFAGENEQNDQPMRSTSGILILFNNSGIIFSKSQLQTVVAKSTAEAEYIAISNAGSIVEGIRNLLEQLGIVQRNITTIFNDNQSAISMVKRKTCTAKTRHIKIAFHYIKQQYADEIIKVKYCETKFMFADILTKALPRPQFRKLRDSIMDINNAESIYYHNYNNDNNNNNMNSDEDENKETTHTFG